MIANISVRFFLLIQTLLGNILSHGYLQGSQRETEIGTTEQGGISTNLQRVGLDQMSGRNSFPVRVVRLWHRWLREIVEAPFLEVFKARLGDSDQHGL